MAPVVPVSQSWFRQEPEPGIKIPLPTRTGCWWACRS